MGFAQVAPLAGFPRAGGDLRQSGTTRPEAPAFAGEQGHGFPRAGGDLVQYRARPEAPAFAGEQGISEL